MFSPEQAQALAQIQKVTGRLKGEIRVSKSKCSLELTVTAPERDDEAQESAQALVSQLANQMAMQLSAMFGLKGEIIDIE